MSVSEKIFDEGSIDATHAGVVDGESVREQVAELRVLHLQQEGRLPKKSLWVETEYFDVSQHAYKVTARAPAPLYF